MTRTIEIKHRYTGAVLYSTEVDDADAYPIRTALSRANLAGADLADANLAGAYLAGANLADANLAGAYLAGANLADANLADADLAGANLADANLADADLAGANLADADLAGANLADANLADADLAGANLADADLAGANLAGADLADANLAGARSVPRGIERKDPPEPYVRAVTDEQREKRRIERMRAFRERNPSVPVVENLDAKILAAINTEGNRLEMRSWHGPDGNACGTTHCRAGWAIFLAGDDGRALERKTNPHIAGRQIYIASTGRVPHFFGSNEAALADIKACAEAAKVLP